MSLVKEKVEKKAFNPEERYPEEIEDEYEAFRNTGTIDDYIEAEDVTSEDIERNPIEGIKLWRSPVSTKIKDLFDPRFTNSMLQAHMIDSHL